MKGAFTTLTEHMPSAHRAHAEWTPSRIVSWAGKVGAATRDLCEAILAERPHPEQGSAPAWASCGSASATARSASKRHATGRCA